MPRFGRVLTAMVTPFTSSGDLDLDEARRLERGHVDDRAVHAAHGRLRPGADGLAAHDRVVELCEGERRALGAVEGDERDVGGCGGGGEGEEAHGGEEEAHGVLHGARWMMLFATMMMDAVLGV